MSIHIADFFREEQARQSKIPGLEEAADLNRRRADFLEGLTDEIPGQLGNRRR